MFDYLDVLILLHIEYIKNVRGYGEVIFLFDHFYIFTECYTRKRIMKNLRSFIHKMKDPTITSFKNNIKW